MVLSLPSLSSSSSSSLNSAAVLSMNLKASSTVAESDTSGLLREKRGFVTTHALLCGVFISPPGVVPDHAAVLQRGRLGAVDHRLSFLV